MFPLCIFRDNLFIAAAISLGQHDVLCKDESKGMFHDVMHDATCLELFVKWPYVLSACLTILNLVFSETFPLQICKNNN